MLGALDANSPLSSRTGAQGLKTSKGDSPTKPGPMAELLPQASLPEATKYRSADAKAPVLGAKRKCDSEGYAVHGTPKKLKAIPGTREGGDAHLPVQPLGGDVLEVRELLQSSSQAVGYFHSCQNGNVLIWYSKLWDIMMLLQRHQPPQCPSFRLKMIQD